TLPSSYQQRPFCFLQLPSVRSSLRSSCFLLRISGQEPHLRLPADPRPLFPGFCLPSGGLLPGVRSSWGLPVLCPYSPPDIRRPWGLSAFWSSEESQEQSPAEWKRQTVRPQDNLGCYSPPAG